jgi:hypothetical protein
MSPGNNVIFCCPHCGAAFAGANRLLQSESQGTSSPFFSCARCCHDFELYLVDSPALWEALSSLPSPRRLPPIPEVPPVRHRRQSRQPVKAIPQAHPIVAPMPAEEQIASSRCANHQGNQAFFACHHCHRCICNLCSTPVDGKVYCPQCFEGICAGGGFSFVQRNFHRPSEALFYGFITLLGLIGLFASGPISMGLLAGPFGLAIGYDGLQKIKKRPLLPGRRKIVVGLILNAIGLSIAIGYLISGGPDAIYNNLSNW